MAQKIGFDAYGGAEMPDITAHAIKALLDHVQAQDARINNMCGALQKMDKSFKPNEAPEINCDDFASIEEADQS
ncbi:MAG: serine O-acetyltransferase [Reinekea sp.]|jgi:serine O-acetyltransferase